MKKKLLLTLLMLAATVATMMAYDFEVDGIYYNKLNENEAEVTSGGYGRYSGTVSVPASVSWDGQEYSVTSIAEGAFSYCKRLIEVTFGENISHVGKLAFNSMNLECITCNAPVPPAVDWSEDEPVPDGTTDISFVTLRVPEESIDLYKEANYWSTFITVTSLDGELEKTASPDVYGTVAANYPDCFVPFGIRLSIPDDADVTYYCRVSSSGYTSGYDIWFQCNPSFNLNVFAQDLYYQNGPVDFIAISPGKERSEVVSFSLNKELFYRYYCDFEQDGKYYSKLSDSTVTFSKEIIDINLYLDPSLWQGYYGEVFACYDGDLVIPSTVEYDGVDYTVTAIKQDAVMACNVWSVDIPATVTSIGVRAFYDCSGLRKVTCRAITPPSTHVPFEGYFYYPVTTYSFEGNDEAPDTIYQSATLFVPAESLEAYRAHEEWGRFSHIVPFIGAGPGDVDGDGKMNIGDVSNLIDKLLSGEELPAYCDVDGDGEINVQDITILIDLLLSAH